MRVLKLPEPEGELRQSKKRLEAARLLLQNEKYEDAVNRAYYSIFHSTKALLKTRGKSPKTHRGLIREFGRTFVKSGEVSKEYGAILSRAESLRESSDYGLNPEIGAEDAEEVVEGSKKFLGMVRERLEE